MKNAPKRGSENVVLLCEKLVSQAIIILKFNYLLTAINSEGVIPTYLLNALYMVLLLLNPDISDKASMVKE